jgi:hypothetical protein
VIPHGGTNFPKTTDASPDPINEPCYSHDSCRGYGAPDVKYGTGVCCLPRKKCDNINDKGFPYLSGSANYYMGGCRGVRYNEQKVGANSTSSAHPSTDDGCAKQGECMIPYLELSRYRVSSTGGGLEHLDVPDATMTTLLSGAIEAYKGACREIYPFKEAIKTVAQVQMNIKLQGDVADYDDAKLGRMKGTLAARLGIAPSRVSLSVKSGSVVLEVVVVYGSTADADAGVIAMKTEMGTKAAAASFLSTPTDPIVVEDLPTPTTAPYSSSGAVYPPPPSAPPAGLPVGAIVGITVGSAVGVLAILLIVIYVSRGSKKVKTVAAAP